MAETSSDSNYSYLNARLRGMKSELFTGDELGRMLQTGNEDGIIRILEKSDYGIDMAESLTLYSGLRAIEEAISRNLFRTNRKMLSLATGHCRELVEILLVRWDIYNIKTILRGIFWESGSERILENIFPAGRLERPLLKELARQSEIKGFLCRCPNNHAAGRIHHGC